MHSAQNFQSLPAVELDIQNHYVGLCGQNAFDAGLRRLGLADDGQRPGAQHGSDAGTNKGGVIRQENFEWDIAACHDPYCGRINAAATSVSAETRPRSMLKQGCAAPEGV